LRAAFENLSNAARCLRLGDRRPRSRAISAVFRQRRTFFSAQLERSETCREMIRGASTYVFLVRFPRKSEKFPRDNINGRQCGQSHTRHSPVYNSRVIRVTPSSADEIHFSRVYSGKLPARDHTHTCARARARAHGMSYTIQPLAVRHSHSVRDRKP